MSLDLTVGTRSAASAAVAKPEADQAAPASRVWLYELIVAAAAACGAMLASAAAVLLYLR